MYPPLLPLVDHAHANGFRVTMITNGLFTPRRMDEVVSRLDGMAISLMGSPRPTIVYVGERMLLSAPVPRLRGWQMTDNPSPQPSH